MKNPSDAVRVSSPQRIIRNTVFSTFSEMSMLFTSLFFFLAAARLGDKVWGQFSVSLAFVGLFSMLILFGFSYSITKVIVRKRREAGAYVVNALVLQALLTIVTLALCYGAALVFRQKYLQILDLILIAFAAESLKSYTLTLRAAAKALGGFHYDTLAMNAERLLLLGVGGGLLIAGKGVVAAASVLAASRLVSFLILLAAVRRLSPDGYARPTLRISRMLVSESWIYVVQSALWRIYDYIDVVMISLLLPGFGPAGLYTLGKKILEGLWLIPNILTEAIYPEIAARHLVSRDLVRTLFGRSLKYLTVTAFVVAVGTVLMAGTVVGWFGADFKKAGAVLAVFGVAVVPSYLRYMFGNTLIAVNLQKKEIMVSAARSVFNVVSNFVLISRYGILGAAAALVATDIFAVVLYWSLLKRAGLIESTHLSYLGKPFAAIVPLIPVYWLCRGLPPALQCAAVLPVYGIFIVWFKLFRKDEVVVFWKSIRDKWRTHFNIPGLPKSK
jgi:O-antigen/teichoic acid export membrane protein